ncbi:MAG: cytochrome c oxidase subunit 2 [Kangiellaceae bacterium]|jgi:cytochrome c oxidase subunit 2
MKIVIVLILLVIATVVFHFVSPWYFTPIASNWSAIDDTIDLTLVITGTVFVLVNLFLAYSIYRYRHNKKSRSHYEPENHKLEIGLTIITTVGVAAMLAPGLFVWSDFINVPKEAHIVEAVGQQWQWSFRIPGKDGVLGKVDSRYVSAANPFGMDPKDETGQDDILVSGNELHLPLDKPVKLLLRSKDVLHNFAVPQFRVKMDLVPGMVTYLWLTPTRTGSFEILCQELCGLAHFVMRGRVIVDSQEDYESWLTTQPTYAQTLNKIAGDPAMGKASYAVCGSCHGAQGEGNTALNAPNLNVMSDWYMARQLNYYKKGIRGAHKDDRFGQQMAAMSATLIDDKAVINIAAYIQSLPDTAAEETIAGNTVRGHSYYVTCATCHGKKGEGKFGVNAPRLAGQHDWYLKRQIENFKDGIRGRHKDDLYGVQMVLMSRILQDERAINDVVAYINTFDKSKQTASVKQINKP